MLLLLFILSVSLMRAWACPTSCICKWKGGKQSVECINKSLITIPSGMDHGTQVLDFAGNNLDRLLKERFHKMGLINLQKIFLSRCRIKHIEDRAFKGLTNLVELDLSDNVITSVPSETFYDYPSLMRLTLNGNPIRIVKKSSFLPLTFLTNLELSKCDVEIIEDGAFEALDKLEWLKLDNNKLKFIAGENILPTSLHGIDLHLNPWQCDCRMIDLRLWLATYHVPLTVEAKCASPSRFEGLQIKTIDVQDLACLPDVRPTPIFLEIAEGQNASLLCQVSSIPEAKVSWLYRGNILQNDSTVAPGLHLYYFVEEGTIEKTSELFIFNANVDDNGTFVCIAENPAGKAHSNYTIRIILKREPIIGLTVFPYEYFVVVSAAAVIIAILGIICLTLCLIQCRRQKKRKRKKDRSKVVALQHQNVQIKTTVARDEPITRLSGSVVQAPKANGLIVNQDQVIQFSTGPGVLVIPNNLKYSSPPIPPSYPDQNPDLINDTGKEWRGLSVVSEGNESEADKVTWAAAGGTLPRRDIFSKHMTADVHLSPGKFIDQDGYPLDYGLPRIPGGAALPQPVSGPYPQVIQPSNFYRTLPHKPRSGPAARFSREAEFFPPKPNGPQYEHFNPSDVRYTAEGYPAVAQQTPLYPCFAQDPFISPPAGYKGDPRDAAAQWPESSLDSLRTQSVAAQTLAEGRVDPDATPTDEEQQPLTESPDEGYEGENNETTAVADHN
ncbi:unnamed protein product [Nesidiocoris tenuis]|uniref:Ig-like domain-containing protein n=1 Tax=Nesidiocoris tenuis TaxID=355587 RepID=A0A6H5HZ71_9HEMI|nr:unnamed protein product [Nesidiocoris tenuis]